MCSGHLLGHDEHDFAHVIRRYVLVLVEDVRIYNKSLAGHMQHITSVFQLLEQNELFIKQSRSLLAQYSLEYLGHIISACGVTTDRKKIAAM
jgi:hypothetical protein